MKWIKCSEGIPEPHYFADMLVWVKAENKAGGYRQIAAYGEWFCERDDINPGDEGYVEDNDEGNYRGYGWHATEESHGGDYDYVTIDLNGRVTHWMPLPEPPK